jgi:hypothetical protein
MKRKQQRKYLPAAARKAGQAVVGRHGIKSTHGDELSAVGTLFSSLCVLTAARPAPRTYARGRRTGGVWRCGVAGGYSSRQRTCLHVPRRRDPHPPPAPLGRPASRGRQARARYPRIRRTEARLVHGRGCTRTGACERPAITPAEPCHARPGLINS